MTTPNPIGDSVYSPKLLGESSRVRKDLSQFSTVRVGVQIILANNHIDPDTIQATVYKKTDFSVTSDLLGDSIIKTGTDLEHEGVGVYSFNLDPSLTSSLCHITIDWEYVVDGVTYHFWDYYQILQYMPTWETLTDAEKGIVEIVSSMFEDLYDSVEGGPHLKEEFQTHFGSERIAQAMRMALIKINTTSQPYTHYTLGTVPGPIFPDRAHSILTVGTYLETIRHLIRSYVEMPTMQGSPGVAYYDRSNYMDRWGAILKEEADDYKEAVRGFKRSLANLGGGSLLVAGGIYGGMGHAFRSGMYASQTRAMRFMYPATVVRVLPGSA